MSFVSLVLDRLPRLRNPLRLSLGTSSLSSSRAGIATSASIFSTLHVKLSKCSLLSLVRVAIIVLYKCATWPCTVYDCTGVAGRKSYTQ